MQLRCLKPLHVSDAIKDPRPFSDATLRSPGGRSRLKVSDPRPFPAVIERCKAVFDCD
jgi:hypothetical protein